MRDTRHLRNDKRTKAMLQLKEEPGAGVKGRARRLVILLSLGSFRLHETHPSTILILSCGLDVPNKFYQNNKFTETDLTP